MPTSVVGRIGRWCFRHWAWVLVIWALAVTAGIVSTGPLFGRLADPGVPKSVESVAANDVISTGNDSSGTVTAVISGIDPADPQVRSAILASVPNLSAIT